MRTFKSLLVLFIATLTAVLVDGARAQSDGVFVSYTLFPCSRTEVVFYVFAPSARNQPAILTVTSLAKQVKGQQFSPYYEQRGKTVVLGEYGSGQNITISLKDFPGPYIISVSLQSGAYSVRGVYFQRNSLCTG